MSDIPEREQYHNVVIVVQVCLPPPYNTIQTDPLPKVDAVRLMKALEERKNGVQEKFIVPSSSHNLKVVESETDPGFTGPVAPAALDKLSEWLTTQLSAQFFTVLGRPEPVRSTKFELART